MKLILQVVHIIVCVCGVSEHRCTQWKHGELVRDLGLKLDCFELKVTYPLKLCKQSLGIKACYATKTQIVVDI